MCQTCVTSLKKFPNTPHETSLLPTKTIVFFDYGRIPSSLPKLKFLERLAIAKVIPIMSIMKMRSTRYKTNQTALFGHTICMPTECDKIMNSYHPELPRTDIVNYV